MPRRLVFLFPLVIVLGLAGTFAWSLMSGRDPAVLPSAMIDKPMPALALEPIEGRAEGLATADLGGRPALVNFFASWCIPCLAEHPVLTRLATEDGIPIFGVNFKDKPADAEAWLARNGDPFRRIGADRTGRTAIDFGTYGVPETFLVDADGRIRWRWPGPLTPDVVEEQLLPLWRELAG
jgi:cytochrome c biogenesis protein CcmG/thiol:disulfide interchange protein DsbE